MFALLSSFSSGFRQTRALSLSLSLTQTHTHTHKHSQKRFILGLERDVAERIKLCAVSRVTLQCCNVRKHAGSNCKVNLHEQSYTHKPAHPHSKSEQFSCICTHSLVNTQRQLQKHALHHWCPVGRAIQIIYFSNNNNGSVKILRSKFY